MYLPFRLPQGIHAVAATLVLTQLLAGCANTEIVSHWRDPQYQGGPLKKIAIFIAAKDETVRRSAEDEAVRNLTGATKGVASYTLYPDQAQLSEADKDAIRARLVKEGIDGALVIRLQAVQKDYVYVPPQTTVAPSSLGVPYRSFYGYSGYAYGYTYTTPERTIEQNKYLVESLVYKLPKGHLIWSTTTQTVNPNSRKQLSEDVRRVLGEELIKDGIIAK